MKCLLSIIALVGLLGLGINLAAQTPSQTPSTPDTQASPSQTSPSQTPADSQASPSATNPDSSMPQSETDATNSQQSARAFEGKIQKSGNEFVLQESATQTSYKLDDQDKAKQFKGKNVKVMATMDPTTNKLHVVDITPSQNQ